jgi:hypothetical protein
MTEATKKLVVRGKHSQYFDGDDEDVIGLIIDEDELRSVTAYQLRRAIDQYAASRVVTPVLTVVRDLSGKYCLFDQEAGWFDWRGGEYEVVEVDDDEWQAACEARAKRDEAEAKRVAEFQARWQAARETMAMWPEAERDRGWEAFWRAERQAECEARAKRNAESEARRRALKAFSEECDFVESKLHTDVAAKNFVEDWFRRKS